MSNNQSDQENVSPTDNYRNSLYQTKRQELEQQLKTFEKYLLRSRDLEHLLVLHNFLLRDSFKEIKAIYERFIDRSQDTIDKTEDEILQKTFDMLFIDNSFDFFNDFGLRLYVNVPEDHMDSKEFYTLAGLEVIYKGDDNSPLILNNNDLGELLKDVVSSTHNIPLAELPSVILKHEVFITLFGNVLYNILAQQGSPYNTISFSKEMDPSKYVYHNASDFKKIFKSEQFSKYVSKIDDIAINTNLIPKVLN